MLGSVLQEVLVAAGLLVLSSAAAVIVAVVRKLVDRLISWIDDERLRELAKELVLAAEESLPTGEERKAWVTARLAQHVPGLPVDKLEQLIQAAVAAEPGIGRTAKPVE